MGKDARGWRCKFAVVAPSTNTIVQPDMDDFRVPGVTNHFGRIFVPNMKVSNDEDFVALVDAIGATLYDAVDRCTTAEPDYLIMGMSALMFWDGRAPSEKRMQELSDHCGLQVSAGSFACEAALNLTGAKRIAVISPYFPVSDKNVTLFFQDCGFDVVRFRGLKCPSPVAIAQVQEDELRRHVGRNGWRRCGRVCAGGHEPVDVQPCVSSLRKNTASHSSPSTRQPIGMPCAPWGSRISFSGHGPLFANH